MGRFIGCVLFFIVLLGCGSRTWAQTDVAVSVFGAFNTSTSGSNTIQSPSNQAGFLIEARHIRNPLVGYEVTYTYNRANQAYKNPPPDVCPAFGCGVTPTAAVPANAHEFTADWVASFKVLNLRPFALVGGGALINVPVSGTLTTTETCGPIPGICGLVTNSTPTQSETKASFIYGAGVDWTVMPHLGLRFQYRGRVSKAPDLATAFSSTNSFTRTSEPVIGAFFRF
jgi:opacity protein-like surface antigen